MTRVLVAALAGLVAGLTASPAATAPAPRGAARVAVVVDGSGPPALLAAARADARRRHATFRAPPALNQQLSVTARLAAEGYATIVGYGLSERAAIAPLRGRVAYVRGRDAAR